MARQRRASKSPILLLRLILHSAPPRLRVKRFSVPRHEIDMTPRDWGLGAAAAALLLDQISKLVLLYGFDFRDMGPGQAVQVLPFFNL